jgi:hypothetical protein
MGRHKRGLAVKGPRGLILTIAECEAGNGPGGLQKIGFKFEEPVESRSENTVSAGH